MKAAWYDRNGAAAEVLQVGTLDDPAPRPGEVLVRIAASAVNPSDVKSRAGSTRKMAFPRIVPHSDGAGTIVAVGEGIDPGRIGEKVWLFSAQWERPLGTAAGLVALPSWQAPRLPAGLDFAQGACLGIPVMTAHRCLLADGPAAGKTVLVTGGAGVVGHYAIQLARWAGAARVLATVSSEEKARHALTAGADATIDYRREDVARRLREETGGHGIDRVVDVDLGANLAAIAPALAPHATIAAYASMGAPDVTLPFYAMFRLNPTIRPVLVYTMGAEAEGAAIRDIERWVLVGGPRFAIAARFPLERIAEAHATVERGDKLGHVIVDLD